MCPSASQVSVGRFADLLDRADLTALTEEAECPVCAKSVPVEAPVCLDGHGRDCPERLCTLCGSALIVHPLLSIVPTTRSARRSSARHAA
jgi:hypothetical protein